MGVGITRNGMPRNSNEVNKDLGSCVSVSGCGFYFLNDAGLFVGGFFLACT